MQKKIRKAVFPVAGLGTRFLPATKAMPKEMLTVVDRPVLQHVVDEAKAAGIEHFIFVTGRNKSAIEDHFDRQPELEAALTAKGRTYEIAELQHIQPPAGATSFTRQQEPLGLGHAVWCAREIVGNEPFALLLPDMLTQCPGSSCLAQMIAAYDKTGGNIVGVEQVDPALVSQYGIVGMAQDAGRLRRITSMVEKPAVNKAPSNKMIMGRYILQPEIFSLLEKGKRGAGGEIQLTDALVELLDSQTFHALEYQGRSFDCGSKLGFMMANISLGLARSDFGQELRTQLVDLLCEQNVEVLRLVLAAAHGYEQGRPAARVLRRVA